MFGFFKKKKVQDDCTSEHQVCAWKYDGTLYKTEKAMLKRKASDEKHRIFNHVRMSIKTILAHSPEYREQYHWSAGRDIDEKEILKVSYNLATLLINNKGLLKEILEVSQSNED